MQNARNLQKWLFLQPFMPMSIRIIPQTQLCVASCRKSENTWVNCNASKSNQKVLQIYFKKNFKKVAEKLLPIKSVI